MKKKQNEKRTVQLKLINVSEKQELDWLYRFIRAHHSAPQFILPSKFDICAPSRRFFRAIGVSSSRETPKLELGVTSYEIRTPFLVETQKTIIAPQFRGKGWGGLVSWAIENHVRKKGFKKIRSCIYIDNLAMIQIKLAQGYIIEGFHPNHDGPGLHEYSLGKILSKEKM